MDVGFDEEYDIPPHEGESRRAYDEALLRQLIKVGRHTNKAVELITRSNDMATLIVGDGKVRIPCHKALLGYCSSFFEAALYRNFSGAVKSEVHLPEEPVIVMRAFVGWLYTRKFYWFPYYVFAEGSSGQVYDNIKETNKLRLWVLGDRLLCPSFSNWVMDKLIDRYETYPYGPVQIEFVYNNTTPESKLRKLFIRLIQTKGPFSARYKDYDNSRYMDIDISNLQEKWVALLEKGGELIRDCVEIGFSHHDEEKAPWSGFNRDEFMQNTGYVTADEWLTQRDNPLPEGYRD